MIRASCVAVLIAGSLLAAWGPRGNGFKGIVRDENDKPVANAWIEARSVEHGVLDASDFEGAPYVSMRTGPDGAYSIQDLPPGLWLVSAVSSETPRSDTEMQELARPPAAGAERSGVAVTRLLNNFNAGRSRSIVWQNLGLASGKSIEQALRCRVTGALAPDHFGYEVQISPFHPVYSGPGEHTVTFSSSSDDDSGPASFYAVPTADGRLDFGGLRVGEYDSVTVDAFTLDGATPGVRGSIFQGQFVNMQRQDGEYVIPLRGQKVVTLSAKVSEESATGRTLFMIWGEHGVEDNKYDNERPREANFLLTEGTYLTRAMVGEWTSPLTPVRVQPSGEPMVVTLPLQECPTFRLNLVDQEGKPLHHYRMRLGVEGTSEFPDPCRAGLYCMDGEVKVSGVLPGTYDVQFQYDVHPPFVQRIELKPGAPTIVVTVPR